MSIIATKTPYVLILRDDSDAENPRESEDCFGRMVCFHSRYSLGDKHHYDEPKDFIRQILYDHFSGNPNAVYDYIKQGNSKEARMEYNRSTKEWELLEKYHCSPGDNWYVSSSYSASLKGNDIPDRFLHDTIFALTISETEELAQKADGLVILPLYLYDHSGITMNTTGFSCPWDSGQVGWIYADKDAITKECGELTQETRVKAENILQGEVEYYDHYLRGDCYGFNLYKDDEEIDSCWGFIGDPSELQDDIECHLPEECKGIMNNLAYRYDDPDIDDILQEQEHELEVG